jgi:hypothetical protein
MMRYHDNNKLNKYSYKKPKGLRWLRRSVLRERETLGDEGAGTSCKAG